MRKNIDNKICEYCKISFNRQIYPSGRLEGIKEFLNRKFCSHKCFTNNNTGINHPLYTDGYRRGREYLRISGKDEYVHRKIMSEYLGRKLTKEEHIHHKDGNKLNNDISNLEIVSNSNHRKYHVINQKRINNGKFTK